MPSQEIPTQHGPERQRMLNVLAQRRYRQRKRERLLSLERKFNAKTSDAVANAAGQGNQTGLPIHTELPVLVAPENTFLNGPDLQPYILDASTLSCTHNASPILVPGGLSDDWSMLIEWGNNTSQTSLPNANGQFESANLLPYGSVPPVELTVSDSQLSAELQDLETSQFTFPAENVIDIPIFKTLEVSLQIAQMLGLGKDLMDLSISRVLDVSKISVSWEDLPRNLHPTKAQLSLPHHPVIDILPWPSVRTRLICLFSQPDQLRPPMARGSLGIMRLMHDLDDESEGLRITVEGNKSCHDGKSWEIGQTILKDWWWALDPEIISNSNRLRHKRGAPKLQLSVPYG